MEFMCLISSVLFCKVLQTITFQIKYISDIDV